MITTSATDRERRGSGSDRTTGYRRRVITVLLCATLALATVPGSALAVPPGSEVVTEAWSQSASTPRVSAQAIEPACADAPAGRFLDVSGVHAEAIDCIGWWGITQGGTDGTFRPDVPVTRAQMASFVARTIDLSGGDLPTSASSAFDDTVGSVHATAIDQLAELGVVGGISEGVFAPDRSVSRAQMASFLARAWEARTGAPLPIGDVDFPDIAGDFHADNIRRIATAGLTGGTAAGTYEPSAVVPRAQMATFLARLLAALVEQGYATYPPADPIPLPERPDPDDLPEVLPGIRAMIDADEPGQWAPEPVTAGAWVSLTRSDGPAPVAQIRARRLPGAADVDDAIASMQAIADATGIDFGTVIVTDLPVSDRFGAAQRATEVAVVRTYFDGFEDAIYRSAEERLLFVDYGDEVVQVTAWRDDLTVDPEPAGPSPAPVDAWVRDVIASVHIDRPGSLALPVPVDTRAEDWDNATIDLIPQGGTGQVQTITLSDGVFTGASSGGGTFTIELIDVAFGDATGAGWIDAALLLRSSATSAPFAVVKTPRDSTSGGVVYDQIEVIDPLRVIDVGVVVAEGGLWFEQVGGTMDFAVFYQPRWDGDGYVFAGVG